MQQIVGLAYCSRPTDFSFEHTKDVLESSRRNNERDGITGGLIYDNNYYLQWLEGRAEDVRNTFERVVEDTRHMDVKLLTVRKIEDRWFPDWSMTAALTQDQTLRGLKLVPHLSLVRFDPYGWSEDDTVCFMEALSDYLTTRPAPRSQELHDSQVAPQILGGNPVASLDRRLQRMI